MAHEIEKSQRITLSFPADLIKQLRSATSKGNISQFVAESVKKRLDFERKYRLRKELIEGYQARSELDRELAEEFFDAEEEAFETYLRHEKSSRKS